jgi:hypothetical protein
MSIDLNSSQANFKLIFIPYSSGEDLPVIKEEDGKVSVQWKNQADVINFMQASDHRTRFNVLRNNKLIVYSK